MQPDIQGAINQIIANQSNNFTTALNHEKKTTNGRLGEAT